MKRTFPLLITAVGGFVLIVAFFIPATETWGEKAAIWFDILASIAFILGGGNLLKIHLQKVSDRQAGWGYSLVTIAAFLAMLSVGLAKTGSRPAAEQQYYGESFVPLPLSEFPQSQVASVDGTLPEKAAHDELPSSVALQLTAQDGRLSFRGWMLPGQKLDLMRYEDRLDWQCTVEKLADAAQPPEQLAGKLAYYAEHKVLSFRGAMTDADRDALLAISDAPAWTQAVEQLMEISRRETRLHIGPLPEGIEIPEALLGTVFYDEPDGDLGAFGPLSVGQRETLAGQFPFVRPLPPERQAALLGEIERRGAALSADQKNEFDKVLAGLWSVDQLRAALDAAGQPRDVPKTACEMLAEMQAGVTEIEPTKTVGDAVQLNAQQVELLSTFTSDPQMTAEQLVSQLEQAGEFTTAQAAALDGFLGKAPTVGQFRKDLCFALLRAGPLNAEQRDWLLADYRKEFAWRKTAGALFIKAHEEKFPWSGDYAEQGTPFWWAYEYAFKPLTATMFAMLAFYVASAAFRAFRAKNLEATLLLGTAFIILLGRTFAGTFLTSWLPNELAGLRIENLTVYIMSVFNTAGNRAIMIGIALGIASTSLKVLLGVDRSYLGSSEE